MELAGAAPTIPDPSADTDLFHPYSRHLRAEFGARTYKVTIAGSATCPTRDGSLGRGGCAFCDVYGSGSYYAGRSKRESVHAQIDARLPAVARRFDASRFLAYFQAYTNTYGDLGELRELFEAALDHPQISGLCIGTRPDCLPDGALDLIAELSERSYVSVELGVQSLEDPVLEWLARGHTAACSIEGIRRLRARAPRARICAHLILGCPPETAGAPEVAARTLSDLGVDGVKLHQLMVLERTELARRWRESPFPTLTLTEYADRVARFLAALSPDVYIERLYALATRPEQCLAPAWSRDRWPTYNALCAELRARGVQQGRDAGERPSGGEHPRTHATSVSPG